MNLCHNMKAKYNMKNIYLVIFRSNLLGIFRKSWSHFFFLVYVKISICYLTKKRLHCRCLPVNFVTLFWSIQQNTFELYSLVSLWDGTKIEKLYKNAPIRNLIFVMLVPGRNLHGTWVYNLVSHVKVGNK